MILSDLLGRPVVDADGTRLGTVLDLRFVIDGAPGQLLADARLDGLVVSPRSRRSYLGYERAEVNAPAIINAIVNWLHRGTFYVTWEAVAVVDRDQVQLRPGYRRFDARMPARHVGTTPLS
ncbi:PRC-barrel domain-containing protein [Glaciibacter sp. 2TAF33]|uniref:PRC-barrel domain-containing protein n=1 Tax=Glaciibacter sp. 2TAF33 TaxID=3233015 RepID=UPI003F8D9B2A